MEHSNDKQEFIDNKVKPKLDMLKPKPYKAISQKIRVDVLEKIAKALMDRPGMTRSSWIQEAVQEKLKRLEDGIY